MGHRVHKPFQRFILWPKACPIAPWNMTISPQSHRWNSFQNPKSAVWILVFASFAKVWALDKIHKTRLTRVGGFAMLFQGEQVTDKSIGLCSSSYRGAAIGPLCGFGANEHKSQICWRRLKKCNSQGKWLRHSHSFGGVGKSHAPAAWAIPILVQVTVLLDNARKHIFGNSLKPFCLNYYF